VSGALNSKKVTKEKEGRESNNPKGQKDERFSRRRKLTKRFAPEGGGKNCLTSQLAKKRKGGPSKLKKKGL